MAKRTFPLGKYGVRKRLPNGRINPEWSRRIREAWTPAQIAADNERSRKKKERNPERWAKWMRRARIKYLYGITEEEYDRMLVAQDYKCAICGAPHSEEGRGKLVVDHCHNSERVRGLLCQSCNNMLGFAKDNSESLRKAATYVESYFG
jgi:hypothetical protein